MKTARILLSSLLIVLLVANYSCKKDDEEDQCEKTAAATITITVKAVAKILDKQQNPVANEQVDIRIERNACGANAATDVHPFTGNTDSTGVFETTYVTISMNNTEDETFITGTAPNLPSTQNWKNTTYRYSAINDGDTAVTTLNFVKDL